VSGDRAAPPPGCVLAVCGWSGSGKTTLLETVIPRLIAQGLRVAAVKHDAHGLALDRPGKDSDRLFRAGADIALRGPGEALRRTHRGDADDLAAGLDGLLADHDLVLVEGHKATPLPKVWLASDGRAEPPPEVVAVHAVLPWDADRATLFLAFVADWLAAAWRAVPRLGGVLIGGASARMGTPKHLLTTRGGTTFVEHVVAALRPHVQAVVLLGAGELPTALAGLPRLADPPGLSGPLAGIVAALRWAPRHALLACASDLPLAGPATFSWLLDERRPGRWAVMPSLAPGLVEPLLAVYEPQARALLETLAAAGRLAPRGIAGHPAVATPAPPPPLIRAFTNVNTPADLADLDRP
jgi:molybdopterin-guanine dinucleotide biosynthesis protein MobB